MKIVIRILKFLTKTYRMETYMGIHISLSETNHMKLSQKGECKPLTANNNC